ncbi:MAG: plasmid pRiA4b ORF-3 family protein [Pseudomonadota bacterium]
MAKKSNKVYQLKVMLKGSKPPIWRRFLVEDSMRLSALHAALQVIMGWSDSHLYQFKTGHHCYGDPHPEYGFDEDEMLEARKYRLNQFLVNEKDSIIYEYDFGDGWEHKITLEKILPRDPDLFLPICVKGKGACPPEDVGGIWGYYDFLKAVQDKDHPEHEDMTEWVGYDYDPAHFDLAGTNGMLAENFHADYRP